jgi:hypothetical protein
MTALLPQGILRTRFQSSISHLGDGFQGYVFSLVFYLKNIGYGLNLVLIDSLLFYVAKSKLTKPLHFLFLWWLPPP